MVGLSKKKNFRWGPRCEIDEEQNRMLHMSGDIHFVLKKKRKGKGQISKYSNPTELGYAALNGNLFTTL